MQIATDEDLKEILPDVIDVDFMLKVAKLADGGSIDFSMLDADGEPTECAECAVTAFGIVKGGEYDGEFLVFDPNVEDVTVQ